MSTTVRFALRDFRRKHRGFWIFLSCLTLGVASITAVMAFASAVLGGIERDGRTVLGGDIALSTQFRPMSQEQLEFITPYSSEVTAYSEMRTLLRSEDSENSVLVELKSVDNAYPLVGEVQLRDNLDFKQAILSDGVNYGAVVDKALVDFKRLGMGSTITLGGTEFKVTAIIENEPDRIGGSENFGFWPRVIVHRDALKDSPLLLDDSIHNREYRLVLSEGVAIEALKLQLQDMFDEHSWDIRDVSDAAPSLREVIDRLSVLLSLAGLTTLLIGGVGISNAIRAYMESRMATIAILKCVGASGKFVLRMYLIQILLLSSIGILVGIGIGLLAQVVIASVVTRWVAVPVDFNLDLRVLAIVTAYGFVTASLFSLAPLGAALNTSPSALFRKTVSNIRRIVPKQFVITALVLTVILTVIAIGTAPEKRFAIWFVMGAVGAWLAFKFIGEMIVKAARQVSTRRSPVVRLAVANLHRPGSSTSDIVLSIGLGLTVLVTVALVSANMDKQINDMIQERAPTFFFLDVQAAQHDEFFGLLENTPGVVSIEKMPYVRGVITRVRGLDPAEALDDPDMEWLIEGDRAFTFSRTAPENTELIMGEWWPEDYEGPPLLSIHEDVANSLELEIGHLVSMRILGRDITGEVYNVRRLEWESMELNFAIMLSPNPLQHSPYSYISTVEINGKDELLLQDQIAELFPNITVVRIKEVLERVSNYMKRARDTAQGVSFITVFAGILVLAGVVMSENRRRAYESVLLKTLGASRRYVLSAYSLEYLMQGTITATVAAVVGAVASWAVLTILMGWNWTFFPLSAASTAAVGLAASMAIGLFGVFNALNHKPLRYLRNE